MSLFDLGLGFLKKKNSDAAAAAMKKSAETASGWAKFTPYAVTGTGVSSYYDPDKNTAGFTLDPRLTGLQDSIISQLAGGMPTTLDPAEATQNYYNQMQALVAPQREQQFGMLQNSQFNNGTLGLSVGATSANAGGRGNSNPALQAFLNSIMNQDQEMALAADQRARQNIATDLGNVGKSFGLFDTINDSGYEAMKIGADLGATEANAGANAGRLYMDGMLSSAKQKLQGQDGFLNTVSNTFGAAGNSMQNAVLKYFGI